MQAKICGLTTVEQIKFCIDYGAKFCGFILNYKKSHRYIDFEIAKQLTNIDTEQTSSCKHEGKAANIKTEQAKHAYIAGVCTT